MMILWHFRFPLFFGLCQSMSYLYLPWAQQILNFRTFHRSGWTSRKIDWMWASRKYRAVILFVQLSPYARDFHEKPQFFNGRTCQVSTINPSKFSVPTSIFTNLSNGEKQRFPHTSQDKLTQCWRGLSSQWLYPQTICPSQRDPRIIPYAFGAYRNNAGAWHCEGTAVGYSVPPGFIKWEVRKDECGTNSQYKWRFLEQDRSWRYTPEV